LLAENILRQPELCYDHKFNTNVARVANRELLVKIITETLMEEPLDHWLKLFDGLG
jgi:succinate--hydroxymethylglutarate CoA-transferase